LLPNDRDLLIKFAGKLKEIENNRKFYVNNKEVEIPEGVDYVTVLYLNYTLPCNSKEEC